MLAQPVSMVKADEEEGINTLTFRMMINHDNDELLEIAGDKYYTYAGSAFSVINSQNEETGVFVIDEEGIGHVGDLEGDTVMHLNDGIYTIRHKEGMRGYTTINDQTADLRTIPIPPGRVSINTVARLYGYNDAGEGFNSNATEYWSINYGTGALICAMDSNPGPDEIVQTVAGWGRHSASTEDWTILDRSTSRNRLIYKIMYYGFKGPRQWRGFSSYQRPFPSRDGSTYYDTGLTNTELTAYYLTHSAVSRAYGQSSSHASENQQGFSAFWSYVNNAADPPENFYVFLWDNSNDPPKNGRRVQDMMISITSASEPVEAEIVVEAEPLFTTIDPVLIKANSRNEYLSGVEFEVRYYNDDIESTENIEIEPVRTWTFRTDENGQIRWSEEYEITDEELFRNADEEYVLLPGNYVFHELYVPDGYIRTDDFIVEAKPGEIPVFWNSDKTEKIKYSAETGYQITEIRKGYLQIHKTGSDMNLMEMCPLAGTEYVLYKDRNCTQEAVDLDGNPCHLVIGDDGYSNTIVMKPGRYYLKETETTLLWALNGNAIPVNVTEDFNGSIVPLELVNEPQPFKMKTTASYREADNEFSGTVNNTFVITDKVTYSGLKTGYQYTLVTTLYDRDSGEPMTDDSGSIISSITYFEPESDSGSCTVTFELPGRILFNRTAVVFEELLVSNLSILTHFDLEDESQTVTFPQLHCSVRVIKSDADDSEMKLAGCEFTVYDANVSIVRTLDGEKAVGRTDENGILMFELPYPDSSYYLKETAAPKGYQLSDRRYPFTVSENIEEANTVTVEVSIVNHKEPTVDTGDDNYLWVWFVSLGAVTAVAVFLLIRIRKTKEGTQ